MPQMTWDKLLCPERSRVSTRTVSFDLRSEFRRDYHRIIESASFRRLQDKTQVYPLNRTDFVRTRLTHSLEVSSYAESLADIVFRRLIEQGREGVDDAVRENCRDILRCAGLVHDIGNPPFGHFGEDAIRQWFGENLPQLSFKGKPVCELLTPQQQNDFLHFEGNAQALRVLTKLHCLVDMENGYNLTYALLNTIIKYPVSSLGINKKSGNIKDKKMGYYCSEEQIFHDITEKTGAVGCRYPLTFLLESADDIAYKTADIEDAVMTGLLPPKTLLEELLAAAENAEGEPRCVILDECAKLKAAEEKCGEMPSPEKTAVQRWAVGVQSRLIYAAADSFVENYDEIMLGEFAEELLAVSPYSALAKALSSIAVKYAFNSDLILRIELSADSIMRFLLDSIVGTALRFDTPQERMTDKNYRHIISQNYRSICENSSRGQDVATQCYYRLLLATDDICGMTDGYAGELYRQICGVK